MSSCEKCVKNLAGGELETAVAHDVVPGRDHEVAFVESLHDGEAAANVFDESDLVDALVKESPFGEVRKGLVNFRERQLAGSFSKDPGGLIGFSWAEVH